MNSSIPRDWIFQTPASGWDLWLAELERGLEPSFELTRFKRDVRAGDRVWLWVSGPKGGLYGRTTVLSEPAERPALGGLDYVSGPGAIWVTLAPLELLGRPLLRGQLKEDPLIAAATIIRAPIGAIHRLSAEQGARFAELTGS
jgi:hypothetical protein